ncbi:MAG TPA: hypothetical protein PKB03_03555, partial [Baekduia sp.]|nr:hypothetical protein [Baekduia sp.]
RHGPDRAGQADLAEIDAIGGKGKSGKRGSERGCDGRVRRRFRDAIAAGNVEVNVVGADGRAVVSGG